MLEKLFALSERNTTVKGEIIAGLTTFITMAYILFLAPNLLSIAGMDKDAVLIATALGGGIVTIAMGLLVNYPICLAPGVGLLAFYTFTVVLGMGVAWQTALGAVFISGIVFLILTITLPPDLAKLQVPPQKLRLFGRPHSGVYENCHYRRYRSFHHHYRFEIIRSHGHYLILVPGQLGPSDCHQRPFHTGFFGNHPYLR